MSGEAREIERIGAVLEDATARAILTETSDRPMSAKALSDRCGVSEPTVYRRLEDLRECELLEERTQIDTDRGHHRTVYAANLERIVVELRDGRFHLQISRREDMVDRFTRLIEGM